MRSRTATLALQCSLFSSLVLGTCTRSGLNTALDNFFANAIEKRPLNLAKTAKFSSDGYFVDSINQTSFGNITALYKPDFKVQSLDTAACACARYTVVTEKAKNGSVIPALLSLRLLLDDNDGPIKEVEEMNILRGQHILFSPDRFDAKTPDIMTTSQATSSTAKKMSRRELINIANTYLEGVQSGNSSLVKGDPAFCPRISNGYQTSSHCDKGMEQFKWPVEDRRWIADEETGVVFGGFIFRQALMVDANTGDYINEYIKVQDGMIKRIYATMIYTSKYIKSVWPDDKERK